MKSRISIFILICSILTACHNIKKKKEIKIFDEKTIQSSFKKVASVIRVKIPDLVITGNYLVLMEQKDEPIFKVFELPNLNYLGGFGRKGSGPNEFGFLTNSICAIKDGLCVFDVTKGFCKIKLKIENNIINYSISEVIKTPGALAPLNSALLLNDSVIIGDGSQQLQLNNNNKLFVKYNYKDQKISYFGESPDIGLSKAKGIFFRTTIAKPDNSKYASFFLIFKMFQIYNNQNLLQKEVIMNTENIVDGKINLQNAIHYYQCIRATNEYIYALCVNSNAHAYNNHSRCLEIWDWKGKCVTTLKLDKIIPTFAVSSDNSKIFAVDYETDNKIFIYDIRNYTNK